MEHKKILLFIMNNVQEIDTLKIVVEALTPLEPDARIRVIDYVCNVLDIGRSTAPQGKTQSKVATGGTHQSHGNKPVSPQEYLRRYDYKVMTKRIGVMAVYIERERGLQRFTFKDITETFRIAKEAKIPAHSQYGRAVVMNYLGKDGEGYYATSQAEALVDGYNAQAASADEGE